MRVNAGERARLAGAWPLPADQLRIGVRPLGSGAAPTVLLLHGYPSSSFDYRMVVPHLTGKAWLTLNFLGFGLSDKPRPHRYSLLEQADVVQSVIADAAMARSR